MLKDTIQPNSATRFPERFFSGKLRRSTPDFSGLDSAAFGSVIRNLRLPVATTTLVLAVATAYRLLTQDPTPPRQANNLPQATGFSDQLKCRQINYILPDSRCENPILLPTPSAEDEEKRVRIQRENIGNSPFLHVGR